MVFNSIIGEKLEIEITKIFPEKIIGRISNILISSEKRIKSNCDFFGNCTGCQWLHIDYDHQLELKKLIVKNNLEKIANNFFQIAYNSNKWEKWMLNNSLKSKIDKAIIAGHYVFSDRNFLHLKDEIVQKLSDKDDFDSYLKSKIKLAILRYCYCLKIINN